MDEPLALEGEREGDNFDCADISRSFRTRFSVFGWVENKLSIEWE